MKRNTLTFWVSFCIFCCLNINCKKADHARSVSLVSRNGKAVGISIRDSRLRDEDVFNQLRIQLIKAGDRTSVLGEFKIDGDEIMFEPLVPFTEGLQYAILLDDSLIGEIRIPAGDYSSPQLLSIYPTQDTLPENLLKLYLEFSQPMVEGRSLEYITLIRSADDTMKGTFLDLQPELWNAEGTVLTLWLDPGRIKRDLIPNKELGAPLKAAENYTLHVSRSWESKNGLPLLKSYTKTFTTAERDDESPDPSVWTIHAPSAEAKKALEVQFPQSLDYFLLKEGITIRNSLGELMPGAVEIYNEEKIFRFMPDEAWHKGRFALHVEARLEDLSGNNLNRPFDQDIAAKTNRGEAEMFIKEFEIR